VQTGLWRVADTLLPGREDDVAAYTQGLMDLGATICTRTRPRCDECPVSEDCIARRDARIDELPAPRPRKVLPRRAVVVLLLERDGEILLEQRPPLGIWGGLWSLPEVACDTDVSTYVGAHLDAVTGVLHHLPSLTHVFTHFALTMHPVRVPITHWPLTARIPGVEWFARDAAIAAAVPAPIRKLLRAFESHDLGQME
jgi:A/G-specific adenine glycosylase